MKQIKIAITGPESSGKTTLAKELAKYFKNSFLVNEFSREYLEKLTRKYIFADLLNIAKGQRKNEIQAIKNNYELI